MYKDFALLCQAFRQAEDVGFRQGVELAARNPPKIGQEKGSWKESIHDYSLHTAFSEDGLGSFSSPEISSMLWLIFESAKEDGINFVAKQEGYFEQRPARLQISEF